LDEALVVGVHLTDMEAKYGWPARSAKAIIGVLLTSMYLPEHLPSVVPPVADETAQEDQVATIMRTLLVHRRVAVLLRVLMERTDRAVSYEALIEEIWLNDPNGAPLSARAALGNYVSDARKALASIRYNGRIEVVYGYGYVLQSLSDAVTKEVLWR
jgi:hypothetical protein